MAEMLDRYELREVLGTGAFATVWRAYDPMLDTDVAIKVLADNWARDSDMRQRFLTEARLALEATSPFLVRVHHVAESSDRNIPYIVMALATGGTLESRLRAERVSPRSPRQALELTRDIATSVAALHDIGLLHRDLKPGNVLFHTAQGKERPILGDFGLARNIDRSALTLVGGTPTYAAPEQAAGLTQLTKQADLYPLGIMFLEMITGDVPHHATMVDAATSTVDVSAFVAAHGVALDAPTLELVTSLLDPMPESRPADAHELMAQIDQVLDTSPNPPINTRSTPAASSAGSLLPPTVVEDNDGVVQSSSPSKGLLGGIGGVLFVVLAGVGAFFALSDRGDSDTPAAAATTTTTVDNAGPEPTEAELVAVTTSETAAPTSTGAKNAAPLPLSFPVPEGAVIVRDLSDNESIFVYNISGTPQEVAETYVNFPGWTFVNSEQVGETVSLVVSNGEADVSVVANPVENTAGVLITQLTITSANG